MNPLQIDLLGDVDPAAVERFAKALKAAGTRPVHVVIDSPGGLVHCGLRIAADLKAHRPGVSVQIRTLCGSMATVIACAAATVKMDRAGLYFLHMPWLETVGNSKQLRQEADVLDRVAVPMIAAYVAKTKLPEEKIRSLMEAESWLTAAQAKEFGFVDEITDPAKASTGHSKARPLKVMDAVPALRNPTPAQLVEAYAAMQAGPARLQFYRTWKTSLFNAARSRK